MNDFFFAALGDVLELFTLDKTPAQSGSNRVSPYIFFILFYLVEKVNFCPVCAEHRLWPIFDYVGCDIVKLEIFMSL